MCNLSRRRLLSFLSENKDSFSNDLLFYESNTQTAGKSTRMGDRENVLKESFALLHFFIALASVTFQFGTLIEGSNPFKKMLFILVLYSKIYVA